MKSFLEYYNITAFDFIRLIFKKYSSIFKGPYLKKLKNELKNKSYVKAERRMSNN